MKSRLKGIVVLAFAVALFGGWFLLIQGQTDSVYADERTTLCVNEVCADADENDALHKENTVEGGYYDWVELYNCSGEAVNASSYYLTDTLKDKGEVIGIQKYRLPDVEVPSHGFLIIYCGKAPETLADGEYISGFGISKKGKDTVYITDGFDVIDSMAIPAATTNKTYSRYPDGGDKITETDATPMAANTYTIDAPVLSRESGFYDPFVLEIGTDQEDVEIHYTTDGKTPTAKSPVYTEPIPIVDATPNKNVYSARKDVSTCMQYSLLKKYKKTGWYQKPPAMKVDKATRIKAVCIGPDGKKSAVVSGIYFIGLADKERYQNIPIISLQASDTDLFSYDKGIYVMGKAFARYKKNTLSKKTASTCRRPQFWTSNYHNGKSIPATVEYFEDLNSPGVTQEVTTKLKGHISLAYPQKSWNVKGSVSSFTLDAGGSDTMYKLKDTTASALSQNLNVSVTSAQICQVFLNGEYWGVYYIGDRMSSKRYYADRYGVAKDSVAIIKENRLNEGTKKDLSDYRSLVKYVKGHNMKTEKNYAYLAERMDIDSMIDYYCAEMFAANTDWKPNKNYAVWRSNDTESEYVQQNGSKWRFIFYDVNVGRTYIQSSYNMMKYTLRKDAFFRAVYKNAQFKKQFKARFKELLETDFSPENATAALDNLYNTSRPYMSYCMKRYYSGKKTISDYDNRYNSMKRFMKKRAGHIKKQLNLK